MKILNIIKSIVIGIIGVIFFGFVIMMTVLLLNRNQYGITQFDDTSLIMIKGEISSNNYKKNDLVFVKRQKIDNLMVGDEVFIYKVDNEKGSVAIDLGTIGEMHTKDNAISFKNGETYAMEFVIGKSDKVYNDLGFYLSIIQSRWGFLFLILVPSFLIFIYSIYTLIVEVKYGKEEEEINN
jgi:hypothetical protein